MTDVFSKHGMRWISTFLAIEMLAIIFLLDQVSKWAVLEYLMRPLTQGGEPLAFWNWFSSPSLPRLEHAQMTVTGFFNITMVWNEGISFGLLSSSAGNHVLTVLLGMVVACFAMWTFLTPHHTPRQILAMIVGGALANLWDRVRFGAVADYLDFHAFGYHYPAFNVADAAIVLGILSLVAYELKWRPPTQVH
jgi:signal peptidase II